MIGFLDAAKLAAGAIIGALAVHVYTQAISLPAARSEARARLIAEQAVQSQKEELERKGQKNNLSPAGTVALLQADRAGAERVISNDRAGARKGCWK